MEPVRKGGSVTVGLAAPPRHQEVSGLGPGCRQMWPGLATAEVRKTRRLEGFERAHPNTGPSASVCPEGPSARVAVARRDPDWLVGRESPRVLGTHLAKNQ